MPNALESATTIVFMAAVVAWAAAEIYNRGRCDGLDLASDTLRGMRFGAVKGENLRG